MDGNEENAKPRRFGGRRILIFAAVLAAPLVALALVKQFSPGLPEIQTADLAAAQKRWESVKPADYDLTVVLAGRQIGELKMTVRNGEPQGLVRNGTAVAQPRTWQPWTVPGMFETLETDFENRTKAAEKFGVDPQSVHMRCEFDPEFGYPKHYLHQIYGRQQDLEWTVTEFVKR